MANDFPTIELDYKALKKELEEFDKEMPNVGRKLMRAVNNEVKKQVRRGARSRGYLARKPMSWGDAGYSKNLVSYADKGYKGKIMFKNDAYQYKFIEYGAKVFPRNHRYLLFKGTRKDGTVGWIKAEGFVMDANPLLKPIADSIWATERASEIMEQKMQQLMNKQFSK